MEMKSLKIGIVGTLIGLLVGVVLGYSISPFLQTIQTQNLQNQINALQSQISQKESQIQTLQNQISEKDSQIQTLQQQVSELETLIGPIRKGDWNLVATFDGSSEVITDYFYVMGTDLRINWTWVSSYEQYAYFSTSIYKEGETFSTKSFLDLQDQGTTFVHNLETGNYYLKIGEANLDYWSVTVETWIAE